MPRSPKPWFRAGRGRWFVQIDGKQTPLPVTDPKDEAAAWDAFRALAAKVLQAGQPPKPAARPGPVAESFAAYLDAIAHKVSPRTRAGYASYLRTFGARFGSVPAAEITPDSVERHATGFGWSDSNRHNYLWTVQAFLRWCGCPAFTLDRPPKESRGADAVIPEAAHRAVLREATGDFHQLCRLLWETGARPMEAAGLTAEAVDWASATATLKHHKTKKKGGRRVLYFNTEALKVLREQADKYKGTGPLFRTATGRAMTLRAAVGRMNRVQEKTGLRVTLYGYRHTFITRALERGVPDTHVAALVGHKDTTMIHENYSHVSANGRLLREQAEKAAG